MLQDTKSIYKYLLHLLTNNKLSEREIKKTVSFTVTSKRKVPVFNQGVGRPVH